MALYSQNVKVDVRTYLHLKEMRGNNHSERYGEYHKNAVGPLDKNALLL